MTNWEQRVWLITGTSSGFGREIALAVLARGGKVVATARRAESLGELSRLGGDRMLPLQMDVSEPVQIRSAVTAAESHFGGIDVLVNNAGYGLIGAAETLPDSEIRKLFEVNFFGLVATTRAVLPGMRRRRCGFIVNISSAAGLGGHPGSAYYCASKFAVEGFTESLRAEVAPLGVAAMAVEPGFFKTEFGPNAQLIADLPADYEKTVGTTLKMMQAMKGREPGDPARAALAIIQAMNHATPPGQLLLGMGAFERCTALTETRVADLRRWRDLAVSADFPQS